MSLTLPPERGAGSKCWYAKISLDDADRAKLDAWVADPDITGTRIAEALANDGFNVTGSQVNTHRRHYPKRPCR